MVDFAKKVRNKAADMLLPGEQVLAACPVQPVGKFAKQVAFGAVGGLAGAAIGARVGKGDTATIEAGTAADLFPAGNVILAVTDQRVIAFEQGSVSGNPKKVGAEWQRSQVVSMSLEKKKLTFVAELIFADGSIATGEVIKGAKPEKFAAVLEPS